MQICEWTIVRLGELFEWYKGETIVVSRYLFLRIFTGVFLEGLVSIIVEITGGTISKVEQIVSRKISKLKLPMT